MAVRQQLKQGLASLPKPKDMEWELELPEEQQESSLRDQDISEEDAEFRDRRNRQIQEAQAKIDFTRRTQAVQKGLPRPTSLDLEALLKEASNTDDPVEAAIKREAALLIARDAVQYPPPGANVKGKAQTLETFDDDSLANARLMVLQEVPRDLAEKGSATFQAAWTKADNSSLLPGLSSYDSDDEVDEQQMMVDAFNVSWKQHEDSLINCSSYNVANSKRRKFKIPWSVLRRKVLRSRRS